MVDFEMVVRALLPALDIRSETAQSKEEILEQSKEGVDLVAEGRLDHGDGVRLDLAFQGQPAKKE